jgi:1-acyl-sn-glycerol-3-phosphate acyltransferase
MFAVLPFVVMVSFFGVKGGNIVYRICNAWASIWYWLIFIRHKEIYEAPHDKTKQYIFVGNHWSYMDVPSAVRCMHQPVRVLGKHEMVRYPVFGWIYRAAVIIVDRSSPEKRAKSVRALKGRFKTWYFYFYFSRRNF